MGAVVGRKGGRGGLGLTSRTGLCTRTEEFSKMGSQWDEGSG